MFENLTAASRIRQPDKLRTGIEFDGETGEAVTPGYETEPANFDEFLIDAGLDPEGIEVIPPVRTSRWQQQKDGDLIWLTSYRFTFRRKTQTVDLPLLMQEAKQKAKKPKQTDRADSALIVLWSDLQVGKVDHRGNTVTLVERVELMKARLLKQISREKPSRLVFADLGDTVENFDNTGREQQRVTNDLSLMDQVDLATTLAWQTLRLCAEKVPQVTYASIGSNHCQWRINGKAVGKATDDWGVFIGRQLARLALETGADNIRFIEPQPYDESLALDVFDDGYHILGLVHGHQATNPAGLPEWWKKQAFGSQPVKNASILCHGHFHHLRLQELGSVDRGDTMASRYLIGASTMDNGSTWYRQRSGEDSQPGLVTFTLYKSEDFTGTIHKL
jgi:hypothetical protein